MTLNEVINFDSITFDVDGYTIDPGNANDYLTLSAADGQSTITISTGTATINASLAGADSLIKEGLGTLDLTTTNSFNGTVVNEGTLELPGNFGGNNLTSVPGNLTVKQQRNGVFALGLFWVGRRHH